MKKRKFLWLVLFAALLFGVAACAETSDDSASLPGAPAPPQQTGQVVSEDPVDVDDRPAAASKRYNLEVACVPQKIAEQSGKAGPDGYSGFPQKGVQPPPPDIPGPDDFVNEAEDEGEGFTHRQNAEALLNLDTPTSNKTEVQDNLQKTLGEGAPPVCQSTGNWKGEDPGPGSNPEPSVGNQPVAKAALAAAKEFLSTKSADAAFCQPIAIVKAGTSATTAQLRSLAGSVEYQLYNDFKSDWSCAYAYYASSPSAVSSGSFPIYVCGGSRCSGSSFDGNWHGYGNWPFYPYTYAPFAQVPDGTSGYPTDYWGYTLSHEALELSANPYISSTTPGPAYPLGLSGYADYDWEIADVVWKGSSYARAYTSPSYYDGQYWIVSDFALRNFFGGYVFPMNMEEKMWGSNYRNVNGSFSGSCDGEAFEVGNYPSGTQQRYNRHFVC